MVAGKPSKLVFDDFLEKSEYWKYRVDNYAGFELGNSVLRLWMGPTEALYYSNAELSDGAFDELPWSRAVFEAKIRMSGLHYGSAGWGFWNHTMVFQTCMPMWFIHLQSRGPYPFQGFFAQVRNHFAPIKVYRGSLLPYSVATRLLGGLPGVVVHTHKPSMQHLDLTQWHVYRVEWGASEVRFYVDGVLAARLPNKGYESRARADIWIDNAVFGYNPRDAGQVYRHLTQENRSRTFLEVDYVKVYQE
ncbi:LamG domain-containing protein [Thermofilum pendens]|uniref:Uncharacterized protein n=1 Tax=Thermofilum pendens (strain DSM 2475 / Hrk 5) TaxID=368408 RepID=A1RZK6_THEPD|nr:family 16 glycosylhydrolase [Thermofilum pendens]ABL78636.1 hypothetical protein Tpen_1238 [Thermofilum pendens Hrk 5]